MGLQRMWRINFSAPARISLNPADLCVASHTPFRSHVVCVPDTLVCLLCNSSICEGCVWAWSEIRCLPGISPVVATLATLQLARTMWSCSILGFFSSSLKNASQNVSRRTHYVERETFWLHFHLLPISCSAARHKCNWTVGIFCCQLIGNQAQFCTVSLYSTILKCTVIIPCAIAYHAYFYLKPATCNYTQNKL